MSARPVRLGCVLVFGLVLALALPGCVGSQLSQIQQSTLTDQQKAEASLHAVEEAWVSAKIALADTLTDLLILGIVLDDDIKRRIRQVRDGGNIALEQARNALESGEISPAGRLAAALRTLQAATRMLASQTAGLDAMDRPEPDPLLGGTL